MGERILLVRLSALGDVVHCLPALASLRAAHPAVEIGWLVEDRHAGVLAGHPQIDRQFIFRRKGGLSAMAEVRRAIRKWQPTVVLDFQGNLKSGFLTGLTGAIRRIGLPPGEAREGSHAFLSETVPPGPPREHRCDRALRVVRALGDAPELPGVLPDVPPAATEAVASALAARGIGRYAVIVPGTSDFGAFKRWPPARFGELAGRIRAERGLVPVVSFGPGQRPLAQAVVEASGGAAELSPETKSLHELIALLRGAALVVGADSGPVAIAAVAGVPTVALFGPKDPAIYRPPGPRVEVVWKRVYCSPCRLRTCDDPICMTTMETDEAWAGVQRLGAVL